jgi:hypothetical protein
MDTKGMGYCHRKNWTACDFWLGHYYTRSKLYTVIEKVRSLLFQIYMRNISLF